MILDRMAVQALLVLCSISIGQAADRTTLLIPRSADSAGSLPERAVLPTAALAGF